MDVVRVVEPPEGAAVYILMEILIHFICIKLLKMDIIK